MRGVNVILLVLALALAGAIAYYSLATDINVSATASRSGGDVTINLDLSNGSLLRAEWLSFSVPSPASIARCDLDGSDITALSSESAVVQITGAEGECRLSIDYYVLGTRRTASVIVN